MKKDSSQKYSANCLRAGVVFLCLISGVLQAQITTRTDAVGKQLNDWATSGDAAGLSAIRYENRDGGHSQFDLTLYPQLRVWHSGGEETGNTPAVGPSGQVRMETVLGNCSMAAPADKGGSLPRIYMLNQSGFDFLTAQYLRNNLYFYPEHQDYDPGYEGRGGWGDLYPANLPCTVISQGSSFTDKPFMQAFFSTLAALPSDTQEKLIQSRLLMPTLQSIFRRSNRMVQTDEDYFTGKAHPPVFDGGQIDEERMISTAHLMTLSRVPPVAMFQVVSETPAVAGQDYFETEQIKSPVIGTTPVALARIFRSAKLQHEIVVKATQSADIMRRDLTFRWALLQGDPSRVKIEPNASGTEAKITVSWHPEIKPASGIESHRVDIGLFASNGFAWSAPALMSFYMLPNEVRFYDEAGKVREICYEAGNPDLGLPVLNDLRWLSLARKVNLPDADRGSRLLAGVLGKEALARLQKLADELAKPQEAWRKLSVNPDNKAAADTAKGVLQGQLNTRLIEPVSAGGIPLWRTVEQAISKLADVVDLYPAQQEIINDLARTSSKSSATGELTAACQRLIGLDVLGQLSGGQIALRYKADELNAGERYQLRHLNLLVLNQALLPDFLERTSNFAFVDQRLTTPKSWRDIYRYGKDGALLGWSRIMNGRTQEFDASGRLFSAGRDGPSVEVRYVRDENTQRLVFAPK